MKSDKFPGQFIVGVVFGVLGLGLVWADAAINWLSKQTPTEHTPQFISGQCFISNDMPREQWAPSVDGIVVVKGYKHYLVMFYEEADRRYAGDKSGVEISINALDSLYHEAVCPKEWKHDGR